jgi:hypothetical protein
MALAMLPEQTCQLEILPIGKHAAKQGHNTSGLPNLLYQLLLV